MGVVAERRDLPFESCTSESRDNVNPTLPILRTIRNVFAVRRPVRLPMVPRSLGDLDGIAATDLLHPDVELSAAIRTVSNVSTIGRPGRPVLQAFIKGNACERALGWCCGRLAALVDP